jgi:ankyrin repeat protein
MFECSVFDTLPAEIILLVVDYLDDPEDLALLRWRRLPELLTSRQIAIKGENKNTILHLLATDGDSDLIEPLLPKCLNPDPRNSRGQTPLSCVAMNGNKAIVKLLLMKDGVDPDFWDNCGMTPLWWAATEGHQEIMKMLLTQGNADPAWRVADEMLPLWAVCRGRKEMVEILLSLLPICLNLKNKRYG